MAQSGEARHDQPILVADDDTETRETLRDILLDAGFHNISESADSPSTLDILRSTPDRLVVLLDWLMPFGGGATVLQTRAGDVPVVGRHAYIVLTADARVSQADIDALQLPSDMLVTLLRKPFSLDEVITAVEAAMMALLQP